MHIAVDKSHVAAICHIEVDNMSLITAICHIAAICHITVALSQLLQNVISQQICHILLQQSYRSRYVKSGQNLSV